MQGFAVGGGSDIALCCDIIVMEEDARIGYPPARVWGCPTTAMWTFRVGRLQLFNFPFHEFPFLTFSRNVLGQKNFINWGFVGWKNSRTNKLDNKSRSQGAVGCRDSKNSNEDGIHAKKSTRDPKADHQSSTPSLSSF